MLFRISLLLTLACFVGKAQAIDLKGHSFTDSYRYSLLEDSYSEKFQGENVILGSYAHVHSPFYYTDSNVSNLDSEIIRYNNVLTLGYTHYWSSNLALGLDVVGVQNKILNKSYSSFGDTNLRMKYLLNDRGDDWGLSLNPFITLPTGMKRNFTTARAVGGGIRAVFEKHLTSWHFLGSAGYAHSPKNEYEIVDYRNLLLAQLGLSYDISKTWNINGEVVRNFTVSADERQDEGDYFLTLKNKTTDRLALYGGGGIAGTETVERNNYTVFVGFKWSDSPEAAAPVQPTPVAAPKPKVVEAPKKPVSRKQEALYGAVIAIDNVYFANNSTVVTEIEREKVLKVVAAYKRLGANFSKVVVEGYASTRGNTVANEALSRLRTQQVMGILESEGVPESKMVSVSYGDQTKQDPAEWKNRKVQFRIYKN